MGKVWRPRRPAEAPLDDAQGVAVGKMRRPATKAPLLKSVAEKDAKRVVASVGVGVRGGETGTSLEDDGTAVLCLMEEISLDDRTAVGVKKDAKDVGKVWRPRKPAKKAPLKAVGGGGVKDTKGVDVIGIDGEVKASLLGAPMVMAVGGTEKGPPEDGIVMCRIDALNGAPVITTTRQKTVGLMKDARGVVVGKIWQPRRPPVKAPLKAVGVKDTEGVTVITVDGVVEASVPEAPVVEAANFMEKGPLEDGIAVCQMNSFNGAPVISTTLQEEVGVKSAEGVVVGKRRRPRRSAKKPLEALGVKNAEGVAVNTLIGKVKPLVLSVPVVAAVGGSENGSLEDGIVVCLVDALHGAPVIATDEKEEVSVQGAVVPVAGGREKGSLEDGIVVCRVDSLNGAPVIATDEKEEVSVLGVPMVAEVGDREKGPLEDGIVVCRVDALNAASVIATDEKEEVWVQGDPMVPAARGREKGSLEDGIVMCRVDTLDRALVISTTREEEVRVKSDEGVVVGKRRRPRRSVKKPLEALGVNDAEGVVVNTLTGEVEPLVLGVPMVTAVGGMEKGSLEHEIVVCLVDAVNGAPVIASDEKEEVSVQGDPMVPAAGGGENGSLDDVIVVCRVDTLNGAPVIATDEKEEVSVQGNPVFPAVDQKVDALVLERMQTITVKGNGKEEKNKEGIKWLKHYSTAQSILIIGDGDFSFSLALATTFGSGGNLVATSLDTYEALTRKYGKAESNVRELKRLGATVLHGVDAETMKLHPYLEMRRFDRIVFNFPHAGFKGKEYQLHVISSHKQLVRGFLANARQLLRPCGEIHLSHKKGFPYDAWGIKKLACESCLIMVRKVEFSKEDYPGYNQKRGDGVTCDDSFPLGPCWTFMFRAGDVETLKKAHGNRVGSISSCLGDPPGKCYPPSISATGMMWPFDLHPTWPQPHFPPVHMPIAFDPFNCYGTSFHHQGHQEQPCAGTKRDLQLRHRKNTRAFKTTAGGREKGSLEDGIVVCRVDALDRAPVISTTREEEVRVKSDKGVVVGKRRRPRRSVKKPLEALGVNDAKGVAVNTLTGEVEPLVLGVSVVAEVEDMEKGPLEDGIVLCRVDALNGAPVIATDEKEEVSAQGDPMVPADGGEEKGSLEDGIVVCRVDALHGAPIISTTRQEEVRVKTAEGVAVGKRRRPRRSAKKPLEALGVKDAEGVAVIALIGEVEPLVLGVPVVAAVGGREKGPLEDGIVVCQVDALNAAPVMATHEKEEVWVQEDPVVAEAGGGEKGSLEDGIVVCPVDTLNGDPFIATDEKEEVSVQGNPVFPTVDQKVDAPVLERMQTITVKGNGKEDKDKEGIKWLKHYSTAQSILVIGDGDFSFSLALATAFGSGGNLVATSLDSYEALTRKYGKAESNVRELKRLGATVLHGVDAETMKLHPYLEMRRFDRIVFNFPHAGFKGKEYQLHVISSHKQLVRGFLANARQLLRPCGEIHISHKKGFPYDAWGIKKLACESCLIMVRKVEFSKKDYPGYNQKRGDGVTCDDSFPLGPCWTFMFRVGDVEKLKKAHGNRVGLISSCLGDPGKCYPPGMSATSMMWPFDLHPAWPQPHFPPVHMPIAFNCYGTSFHHQHMVQPTHQEHPWYKEGPPIETPQEHQSLQREYEIHRQLMRSLEDRYMESVERQATLETLIQVYGRH